MQGQDTGETEIFQVYKPQTQNRGLRYFAWFGLDRGKPRPYSGDIKGGPLGWFGARKEDMAPRGRSRYIIYPIDDPRTYAYTRALVARSGALPWGNGA